jgi:carboxypeptidase Taq
MEEKLNQLKEISAEIADLAYAASVLGWDQQVNMPPMGAEARGNQLSTLQRLMHGKSTTPELGALIEELTEAVKGLDPDSNEARLVKVTKRDYDKAVKVPPDFTAEFAKVTSLAFGAWNEARQDDDFSKFQPHLEKIIEMNQQFAEYFAPYEHVYDPLLDRFEPGMKTADVKEIFDTLRPQQVELIQAIAAAPQIDDSFLFLEFDEQKQWDFGVDVITKYGFDWSRGRQDKSPHPFTTNFSVNDVRITTRVDTKFLNTAIFGTLHECGHALYELGVSQEFERNSLGGGASLALHESQSRMYENLVGRSTPFWDYFYPRLQEIFPDQLRNVNLDKFYKGINIVKPSLIRVEADEVTYNLHIMLRLEIEIALMENRIAVKDLPEIWNSKMDEYLGVTPPNDADGVLQDIHWAFGVFGYFSTYALGNLISVQIWEKIKEDIPDLDDQIRNGEFGNLLDWLIKNIHAHGKKYDPQELVQQVTGTKIDSAPYMRYLKNKYGEIYGI